MVKQAEPITLTPYDLMASETSGTDYAASETRSSKGYEQFNNWSNWGNGPRGNGTTGPALSKLGLEKALG